MTAFADRYEVLETIGAGATSRVVRARDRTLGRGVVAKLLTLGGGGGLDGPDALPRFRREAAVLARIRHPNVLEVLDHGVEAQAAYLVYPDEGGESLRGWLAREGVPSPARAVEVLDAILSGLEALHEAGFVHRDLKPENVLITEADRVKVFDLGLAKAAGGGGTLTQEGWIVGTPAYLSPQQIRGQDPDPRDDLYAAGWIGWELATGRHPYRQHAPADLLRRHLDGTRPSLVGEACGVPAAFARLVDRLTSPDRDGRPGSAQVARQALGEASSGGDLGTTQVAGSVATRGSTATVQGDPVEASPLATRRALRSPPRGRADSTGRRRSPATQRPWGVVAALTLALLGATWLVLRNASAPPREPGSDAMKIAGERPGDGAAGPGPNLPVALDLPASLDGALRQPLPEDLASLVDDPQAWGRQVQQLAPIMAAVEWLAGQRFRSLSAASRERLQAADAELRGVGIEPVFLPLLRASPEGPSLPASRLRALLPAREIPAELPDPLTGYLADATRRFEQAVAFGRDLQKTLDQAREEQDFSALPESLTGPFPSWNLGSSMVLGEDLTTWVRMLWGMRAGVRLGMAEWMRPGFLDYRTLLVALARSIREEPATAEAAAALAQAFDGRLQVYGPSLAADAPLELLTLTRGEGGARRFFEAVFLERFAKVRRGARGAFGDAEARAREAWIEAARGGDPTDRPVRRRWSTAAARLVRAAHEHGALASVADAVDEVRARLDAFPGALQDLRAVVLEVLTAACTDPRNNPRQDLLALASRWRGFLEEAGPEVRARVDAMQACLQDEATPGN